MATTSKRFGLTNEEILSLLQSINYGTSFDLSDNISIKDCKPQSSEILTESDFSSDNDNKNSTDKLSTEKATKKYKSGIKWSL